MRIRAPYWGAVSVLVCLLATASLVSAATISVPAGGDLQKAIDAAKPGDVITLAPGAVYTGNFVLRNKGAVTDYITIRSAASDAELPRPGIRMTPQYAALLPKIKSPNNMSALRTATSAHHWKLLFLEFQANYAGYGDIISLGASDSTQTSTSQAPYSLELDRIYVHGDPLFGQKRCISLNSRDTQVINSYVSDCKAIGQDSQAIGGFNGPGGYWIENNYLEGAAENVMFGGSDPTIPNLVTADITFRHNHLSKPLAWRDPIVATPKGASASFVAGAGSLGAGTYGYRVAARLTSNQNVKATSAASVEVSATIAAATTGGVRVTWTAIPGAEYLVYGRTTGGQSMYWKTSDTYFIDTGAAGTAVGSPSTSEKPTYGGTKWAVKNTFELKNAQDVLIEGNVFENLWVADQTGYPIAFTPRNQDGRAPWAVVQRVVFRHNLVRHTAGGVNILGQDNIHPSQRTNTITVSHNVFDDLTSATWGSGSRPFMLGDGPDKVAIDHNTIFSTNSQFIWLYGAPTTNSTYTNNMARHNLYGIMASGVVYGNDSINHSLPGLNNVTANVIAGASASKYPAGNYYPSVATWTADLPKTGVGDYRLRDGSMFKGAGLDGKDLGADIDALDKHVPIALSGRDDANVLKILPALLNEGVFNQSYVESIACAGNTGACVFSASENTLPAGLSFDATAGLISGVPQEARTGSITISAYDSKRPQNSATATLEVKIGPPPMSIVMPPAADGQVGNAFTMATTVEGAMGATTWSVIDGALPPGTTLDPFSGVISGVPSTWGGFTATVAARDSWTDPRVASAPTTIAVLPANLAIDAFSLANAIAGTPYTASFTASGGTGHPTWSVIDGHLPDGMTLDGSGVLNGTPTVAATFTFTLRAADALYPQIFADITLALNVDVPEPVNVAGPEIVLYAADATKVAGTWSIVADASAAGGRRVWNKDVAAANVPAALANPANYFELAFNAVAGMGYHLWLRGKADKDSWANDSVFVQFSGSVNAAGTAVNRIGTTGAATVSIEEGANAGVAGWGWADENYGALGGKMYFKTAGPQTIRIQVREDGMSIDQIVLSANRYATRAPGKTKNDTTILTSGSTQPTMSIDVPELGHATYGTPFAATLSASGSTGSTIWSVVSGQLPEGMALSAGGALSGTPTSIGDFTFTVRAQDADWQANVATAPIALTVVAPDFTVAAPEQSPAAVGQRYDAAFTATGNVGAVSWTIASGTLPAGLAFDANLGVINGEPTEWGMFAVLVQGADTSGRLSAAPLTIIVVPTPVEISPTTLVSANYKTAYTTTMTATGGTGAVSWTAIGVLPAGLTLAANGVVSGTPTEAGTFMFDVRVNDTNWEGDSDTKTIVLDVQPPAFWAAMAPTVASGRIGTPLQPLVGSSTGNVGTVSWAIVTGTLPPGVVLDPVSGNISGTPKAFGHFDAAVKAKDSWNTATRVVIFPVTIDVAPPKPVREIVLYTVDATRIAGTWSLVADAAAAGGKRMWNKDLAAPKLATPLANPANYFELTFKADAGVGYHLWLRGKADKDSWANDSVFVQFSGSVNATDAPVNRIGTTNAAMVSIEDRSGAGVAGWGWADDSYGSLAGPMYFAATGTQTIRIQVREDGLSLDQIVLSADRFSTSAPGATKHDTTILKNAASAPTLTIDAVTLGNATYRAAYSAALSATGSTGSIVWSVVSGELPQGMTLDASGTLHGTPTTLGDFSFTVKAQDAAWQANAATAPVALTVVAPVFSVTAPAASPAMVGQSYAAAFTAVGNVGGVSWTVASGVLPAGLTLDAAAGTINGQPTAWGSFAALVQGADSIGRAEAAPITIVVSPTPLTISTTTLAPATFKTAYSATLGANGGTGLVAWTLTGGALPAGVTLNAATGVVSGTPVQAGTFVFEVRAVDGNWEGDVDTKTIALQVEPPVFTAVVAPAAVSGRVGTALQALVGSFNGNVGSVSWSLASGALPAGVSLDAVSGIIAGTPSSFGRFTAEVKAEDSWRPSRVAVTLVMVEVAPRVLSVATEVLSPGNLGQAYAAMLTANGGTGTTTWQLSGGALPAGIVLGADGAFTGTPTAAGTFTFTVLAVDAGWAGSVAAKDLTLTVGVREVVLYAAAATLVAGKWSVVADATAAGGARMANPDANAAKVNAALANPVDYFEMTFQAQAGVAYHLWLRGKAEKNTFANDSVFVQFSGSVNASGAPVNRIGTTGAATVSIEEGTNAGLANWGWADDSNGGFAGAMYFATTGTHTLRIQVREDGLSLVQIVLSADKYAAVSPGATKNDTTILAR